MDPIVTDPSEGCEAAHPAAHPAAQTAIPRNSMATSIINMYIDSPKGGGGDDEDDGHDEATRGPLNAALNEDGGVLEQTSSGTTSPEEARQHPSTLGGPSLSPKASKQYCCMMSVSDCF